jgi:hypothetical protein
MAWTPILVRGCLHAYQSLAILLPYILMPRPSGSWSSELTCEGLAHSFLEVYWLSDYSSQCCPRDADLRSMCQGVNQLGWPHTVNFDALVIH